MEVPASSNEEARRPRARTKRRSTQARSPVHTRFGVRSLRCSLRLPLAILAFETDHVDIIEGTETKQTTKNAKKKIAEKSNLPRCSSTMKALLGWQLVGFLAVLVAPCTGVVTIEKNGYKGVVVAIQKDVPDSPDLVQKIKDTITEASAHLHKVTRDRAYFEEVTIVVPPSWTPAKEYEVVQGGDRFHRAEVRVDFPNPAHGDTPYTQQPGECGEPGEFIHLTPDFLLGGGAEALLADAPADGPGGEGATTHWPYGSPAKVFVHEWAHLRYGTFDEHGYQSDEQAPAFYMDSDNKVRPTACANDIRGWLLDTAGEPCILDVNGMPNANCVFYPEGMDKDGAEGTASDGVSKASVMYMPSLDSADGFCDDENPERKHNSLAPNKQNLMCQGRSTWDVIAKHPDFNGDRNQARNLVSTNPKFRIIQPKKNQRPTFVLVLDISGSMRGSRIELLRAATSRFIKFQLSDFCTVGMVAFSTTGKTLANMTTMDDITRETLLTRVPTEDDTGFTAIGLGIQEALKLLRSNREPTEGTLLLLVSDGEENVEPYLNNIMHEILESKVIINTIAFGRHASNKLEKLVKVTGGRGFFYDDEKVSHKMLETAFIESAATHADIDLQSVEIVNRNVMMEGHQEHEGHFTVDKDIGTNTMFLVTYDYPVVPEAGDPLEVLLWSPKDKKYSSSGSEYKSDRNTLSISIKIPEAEPGKWTYSIKNKLAQAMDVTLLVSSETKDIKEQPIRVRSWVSDVDFSFPSRVKVYAEVKKGYNAILDASVIATVGRPVGEPWIMMLFDNGAGPDTQERDGIYSGYFSHFNGTGRYSVEAVVLNNGRAHIDIGSGQNSRAPRLPAFVKLPKEKLGEARSSFPTDEMAEATDAQLLNEMEAEEHRRTHAYQPIDEFERFASAGAFRLNDWKDADLIPPSRITDLHIVEADLTDMTVHVEWTSPGDDLDDGQAVIAELRYHHDPLFLLKSFNRATSVSKLPVLEGSFLPPKAKQLHAIKFQMPAEDQLQLNVSNFRLYFAVRVIDDMGNEGDVSNLALAHFRDPASIRRLVRPDRHPAYTDANQIGRLLLGIGITIAVVIIIVAIALIACKMRTNRRKKYECERQQRTSANQNQMDKLLA